MSKKNLKDMLKAYYNKRKVDVRESLFEELSDFLRHMAQASKVKDNFYFMDEVTFLKGLEMFNGKKEGYLEFVKHNTDPVKVKAGQSKKEKDKTEVIDESDDEDGEDEEYLDEQGNVVDPDASHDLIAPPIPVNHDDDEKSMKDTVEAGVDMERSSFDDLM